MITLYSLRTDGSGHRITKFVDGEVESSYLTSRDACECPAGHRSTCRHRQMLPQLIAEDIANTHWFWNFDLHRVVDFDGMLKSNFDAMNELADRKIGATLEDFEREHGIMPVGEAQQPQAVTEQPLCIDEGCPQANTEHVCVVGAAQHVEVTPTTPKPWRRL
jgi:hypothetical protein